MDRRTSAIADWIGRELASLPEVRRAIIFGSRARGDCQERSDIDVAVEAPAADAGQWARIVETIDGAPTLLRIDVVRWETASREMRNEIERDGVTIYGVRTHAA